MVVDNGQDDCLDLPLVHVDAGVVNYIPQEFYRGLMEGTFFGFQEVLKLC